MNNFVIIGLSILCISFAFSYLALKSELKETKLILDELVRTSGEVIENSLSFDLTNEDIHKENFIKFLSDSRDWAYEYIEKSQLVIKEIADELKEKQMQDSANKLLALLPEIPNE